MKKQAFVYIFLASLGWGMSGVFVYFLSPYGFTSFQMTGARGIVSFLCMLAYAMIYDRRSFRINLSELVIFVFNGVALFCTAAFYYTSMQLSSVSTAVVLMYSAPIYVMLFSVLFLGEHFSAPKLFSVGLVVFGCVLVSGIVSDLSTDAFGILFGVMSGVAYAAYNILTKISMRRGSNPASANLYTFMSVSAIALVFADPLGTVATAASAPGVTVPLLAGIGIVTFVLPYFLYTMAMKSLPAGVAASLAILEPMIATVISVVFLGDRLDILKTLGIILILTAVFLLGREQE